MKKLIVLALSACLVLVSAMPVLAIETVAPKGAVYVSPEGNDSADGSFESPLKTLKAAQNKVRSIKGNYENGVNVYVRGGNYNLSEALIFTKEDSGTLSAPITYRAYKDEKVTLTGGVAVNGSAFTKVTDPAVLDRLIEKTSQDNLYSLDLKAYGIRDLGEYVWIGSNTYSSWYKSHGLLKQPEGNNPEVFFNGQPMQIARYPDSGYLQTGKIIEVGWNQDAPTRTEVGAPFTMEFKSNRLEAWSKIKPNTMLMLGYWKFDWSEQTVAIAKIDTAKKTITSNLGAHFGIDEGRNFYIYNVFEELSIPGEYYIDYDNFILYLIPPTEMKNASVMLSALAAPLVQFNGASNITLSGIDITGTRSNCVYFDEDSSNNCIKNAEISYSATYGVMVHGINNGIRDSYIHDVDGGVYLEGGNEEKLISGNCYAINNEIENYSRISGSYIAGVHFEGVDDICLHNEIHGGPHLALQLGGIRTKIMYNDIYDVLNEGNDAGAIYSYLDYTRRGIQIKYNHIHDCKNPNKENAAELNSGGILGIYLDGGLSDVTIVGNVFENFSGIAYAINGGRDNVFANNIIANCGRAVEMTAFMTGTSLESHNKSHMDGKDYLWGDTWRNAFPRFSAWLDMSETEKKQPADNVITNNVIINTPFSTSSSLSVMDIHIDYSNNLIDNKDPGFKNMAERDFNVLPDATLFTKLPNFKAVPFTRMGRLNDLAEARAKDAVLMVVGSTKSMAGGKIQAIDENEAVVPFIQGDVTYIPLRFLAEALGASVGFENGEVTITSESVNLKMQPTGKEATKNGEKITLENELLLKNERTMVPLREVSELLNKKVYWYKTGFISISDDEELFSDTDQTDENMVIYLYNKLSEN